tara:strand:+ start:1968 stop:4610 length:2643 start_codon:yes stop_codon:yes gene_type:complete
MAAFTVSQYGKFVSLQNNSGSADAAAPNGGIYLFASGAVGSARLYLQNEGGTVTDLAKAVDIDAFTAGSSLHQTQDHFLFSDNGTEKKITFSDLEDAIFGNVSGDAAIAAGGALTIANDAVEQAMIADDAVGADQLAANAVVNASIASDAAIDMDKLDGGSLASSLSDLAQGDLLYAGDVDDSNNIKSITFSDLEDAIFGNVSGDVAVAAGGAVTIQADAVESGMLNDNVISGQTELASDGLAAADEMMISDGGTLKKIGVDNLFKDGPGLLGAEAIAVGSDHFMFLDGGATGDAKIESVADLMTAVAGDGLAASSGVLAVGVDDATIELNSDALRVKDGGIDADALASSVAGNGLTGGGGSALAVQVSGAVHITSDKVALSGSVAGTGLTFTGAHASIATLAIDIDELTAKGDASLHQTQDHFLVSDNGTEKKITFSNLQDAVFADVSGDAAIAAGGALTIANDAVESGMLNDNVISGQTELASDGLAAADEMMISDGGTLKKIGVDNLMKDGPGLLTAAAVAVADDHFMFLDGGATGDAKIESVADLMTAVAGNGLAASSGVLAVGVDDSSIELDSDALRVKASGVTNAMLAGSIANAKLANSSVTVGGSAVSLGGTVTGAMIGAALNSDLGGNVQFGTQSDDTVAFGGPIKIGGNAIANSEGESTITMDADQNVSVAASLTVTSAMTIGGGYGDSGVSVTAAGAINADGALTIGADGAGVNFTAHGGAANEVMRYDAGNHVLQFVNSSGATMLNLGGDATSEFALDVANGSDNINKVRAAAFVTYSDESLKSDVASMGNTALDTVMSLEGVEFTWKDSGERDFGFIAQDVQSVLPQAVHVAGNGVQGVDYSRLTSVLVEAVKAQQVQIEELKALLKK